MAGVTETAGHRALRSCARPAVIGRAGSPSGLRTTPNTSRERLPHPVLDRRYHMSRAWVPSSTCRPGTAGQPRPIHADDHAQHVRGGVARHRWPRTDDRGISAWQCARFVPCQADRQV